MVRLLGDGRNVFGRGDLAMRRYAWQTLSQSWDQAWRTSLSWTRDIDQSQKGSKYSIWTKTLSQSWDQAWRTSLSWTRDIDQSQKGSKYSIWTRRWRSVSWDAWRETSDSWRLSSMIEGAMRTVRTMLGL